MNMGMWYVRTTLRTCLEVSDMADGKIVHIHPCVFLVLHRLLYLPEERYGESLPLLRYVFLSSVQSVEAMHYTKDGKIQGLTGDFNTSPINTEYTSLHTQS
jgi:hypothetical protein